MAPRLSSNLRHRESTRQTDITPSTQSAAHISTAQKRPRLGSEVNDDDIEPFRDLDWPDDNGGAIVSSGRPNRPSGQGRNTPRGGRVQGQDQSQGNPTRGGPRRGSLRARPGTAQGRGRLPVDPTLLPHQDTQSAERSSSTSPPSPTQARSSGASGHSTDPFGQPPRGRLGDQPDVDSSTPMPSTDSPVSVKRKEYRAALSKGGRVPRTKKSRSDASDDGPVEPLSKDEYLRRLDRAIRWHAMLYHTNVGINDVLRDVTNNSVSEESPTWTMLRTKALDNIKSFKNKTIDNMLAHVKALIEKSEQNWLASADENQLKEYMTKTFNSANYFSVFYYMKNYVNIETSSKLGRWYLMNIYVALGAECKKMVDNSGDMNIRVKVLNLYDIIATSEEFDSVDKQDFVEIRERERAHKEPRARNILALSSFRTVGGPPPDKAYPHLPHIAEERGERSNPNTERCNEDDEVDEVEG